MIKSGSNEMGRACSIHGSAHKGMVGRPAGKRPLRRPRHKREDNINMNDFKEIGWVSVDWIQHSKGEEGPVVVSYEHGNRHDGKHNDTKCI
jgi:hypothetical protein